jgi:hypothetical protein
MGLHPRAFIFLGAESSSDSFLRCVLLMKNSNNPDHKT